MQLDYIENVNEYGDSIVRLYDFDKAQAEKFRQAIQQTIIAKKKNLTSQHSTLFCPAIAIWHFGFQIRTKEW